MDESVEVQKYLHSDLRSIHFLPFPEDKRDEYDATIERKFSRMKTVIESGRILRESNKLSQKVCVVSFLCGK